MRALGRVVCFLVCVGIGFAARTGAAQQATGSASGETASAPAPAAPPEASNADAAPAAPADAANAGAAPAGKADAAAAPGAAPKDESAGEPGHRAGEPRYQDANSDRVILFSTAETHPAGTFFFSDYELILLQFGYAFTDNLQLSLSFVPPIVQGQPYFFDLALKAALLRSDVFRLGVVGAGTAVFWPDADPSNFFGARLNGVGQFCFESLCRSSFSLNVGTFINSESNVVVPITFAGGLVVHASDLVKILVEPAYALGVGKGVEDQPDGFLFNYGVRLSANHFGFDFAFLRPIGGDSPFILGLPWIALTYRTSGAEP